MEEWPGAIYLGSASDDAEVLSSAPAALRKLLEDVNGFVAYSGGLHVRGACQDPPWHSLREAWLGEGALWRRYWTVTPMDVPFAEEAFGDQFLLRDGLVVRLNAETADLTELGCDLDGFLAQCRADPVEFLMISHLVQFLRDGKTLKPGELLHAYPPFSTAQAANGVHLSAVPAAELHLFQSGLAKQMRDFPEGASFRIAPSSE